MRSFLWKWVSKFKSRPTNYATPKVTKYRRCNIIIQIHKFTIKIDTISINLLFECVKIVESNFNSHVFLVMYQEILFANQQECFSQYCPYITHKSHKVRWYSSWSLARNSVRPPSVFSFTQSPSAAKGRSNLRNIHLHLEYRNDQKPSWIFVFSPSWKQNWSKTVASLLDLKNKHLDLENVCLDTWQETRGNWN